jgi:hypothetical protein
MSQFFVRKQAEATDNLAGSEVLFLRIHRIRLEYGSLVLYYFFGAKNST